MTSAENLLRLELEVVGKVAGSWKNDVGAVKEAVLTLASQVDDGDMSVIVDQVMALLNGLEVPATMDAMALNGVEQAHHFGSSIAHEALGNYTMSVPVSKNSLSAVDSLYSDAVDALDQVKQSLSQPLVGSGIQSIVTPLNPLFQNPAKVERAVTWAVNNASNSAVSKISLKEGETMVWISERDGCVHCTAYAGVRSTLTGFPKDLTFGSKPLEVGGKTLPHPPLHPHCRCRVEPNITDEYADALKREAVRSILKGFSMDSESDKVRIDAAKRLLDEDPVAPASVKKYAERAITKGSFDG